jgi:superfamily II DNA or RNA helicase
MTTAHARCTFDSPHTAMAVQTPHRAQCAPMSADPDNSAPPDGDIVARVEALGPSVVHVALAYGVAYPLTPAQERITQWLDRMGRREARPNMRQTIAHLVQLGILEPPTRSGGYRAASRHSAALVRHAQRLGILDRLLTEITRDGYVRDWSQMQSTNRLLLRSAVIAEDWRWLRVSRGPIDWREMLDPELVDGIARLPEPWQDDAVYRCTIQILENLHPAERFLAACEAIESPHAATLANVALVRLAQGQIEALERWLARIPRPDPLTMACVRAAVFTMRGADGDALATIRAALALARGESRKRVLFPPFSVFTFALLSLVRLNTHETNALFDELLANARKLRVENLMQRLVEMAQELRKPPKPQFTVAPRQYGDLHRLCSGLVLCWSDSSRLKENAPFFRDLTELRTRAEEAGFLWMAAELDRILVTADPAHRDVGLHARLGTVSLASAIPRVEIWEHGLNALEQLAASLRDRKPKRAASRAATRRLAWVLREDRYGDLAVEPREQTLQKKGWSKGKPVSLAKLREGVVDPALLTEQDREVTGTIAVSNHHWGPQRELHVPPRGIFLLAGHPCVLDAELRPLEIVAVEPELVIDERGSGAISAALAPYPDEAHEYQVHYDDGDLITVMHLNESVRRLRDIIPPEGLELPGSARVRLLEVVSDLAADVRVHGGLSGVTANARVVPPDGQPWVCLTPLGNGLAVRVYVEPVAGSRVQFEPGAGGELVLAHVNDEALQTRRVLGAERHAAIALADQASGLAVAAASHWRAEIEDPEDCLELLDQLRKADARCVWPEGEKFRIVAPRGASALKLTIRSGREWFSASGEIEIDEERTFGLMQLMTLLDQHPRSRFVPLGAGEFLALSDGLRQQVALLKGLSLPAGKSLRLHPLAAPALDELLADASVDVDAAWEQQVARMRAARGFTPTVPDTLQAELRPYQQDGIVWLARLARWGAGACLADDMGLGKTLQTLGLLLIRAPEGPALVVVPTSLVDNWQAEARRFAPTLNLCVYGGGAIERHQLLENLGPFAVLVCTYGLLHNDIESFAARRFHTLVLDEAQAVRNYETKRSQAVRALDADFRVAVTGTPVQNNLMDLHALISFLNPGLLGSAAHFREAHALPIERERDPAARSRLSRLIAPFVLRRTKTEVLEDLPPRTEIVRSVTLGPEEAMFYEALRRQALADLEGRSATEAGTRQFQVLAHLTRLRLACCHPQLVQDTGIRESAKLTEFMTLLDEPLQNRHKVLVFSQFVKHLKLIEARLADAGISYQYLDGQTPRNARSERIQAFQSGVGDVFLISLKAGGTGLNLTAADYVIHMDPWWNPAAEDQASDRAHRIGQTRPVTIYRLVAKGTVEEQIVALHHRKRELAEQLLQDADQAGALDVDALLELLREPLAAATP